MSEQDPDLPRDAPGSDEMEVAVPNGGRHMVPVVALGGSAGAIEALATFFKTVPADTGLAYVVVLHLSPEHESTLAQLLQRGLRMPVVQVQGTVPIVPNQVYVIPPRRSLRAIGGRLELGELASKHGRHVAVDLFFRTLADTHGARSAAIVLSGADGDGAIGIKRVKERGGLTVAQDPDQAEHGGMPRAAIATGMVDWVLRVEEMVDKLAAYFRLERQIRLPPEEAPPAVLERPSMGSDESSLREVLAFLRTRTGRDFSSYKRATILRRIGRRMQVNGIDDLQGYLSCLRTRPGESGALLQDLLISVTNFFRDAECFAALEQQIPALFASKRPNDSLRVWVAACATGEEAYSVAMLLSEHARLLESPPVIQIFATDLDEEAIQAARDGVYPAAIEADVSDERLRRFFTKEHRGYRVRRELREMVLFAMHDVLKDSPFSRLDMVSCRNLLIYLNREAQARVFDTFQFALLPGGRLFLGSSESVEDGSPLFGVVDKKHRVYMQRPTPRSGLPVPSGPGTLALAMEAQQAAREGPLGTASAAAPAGQALVRTRAIESVRHASWGELHLQLLEQLAPPSILVDSEYEIVHLSPSAGRFLQFSGGEPSRSLLRAVNPSLRIELRAALYQAAQGKGPAEVRDVQVEISGEMLSISIHVAPVSDVGSDMFLVMMQARPASEAPSPAIENSLRADADPVARHLDRELERLKSHLRDTVEQYEASTEELKASNEELQAMNEELRSATEELETSREELQSINEELTTVNHELKSKVDELGHANSDMHNLMDATAIATVFLDRELRITRYTPSAVTLFNLIPTDVGRPLTDLTSQLNYDELGADAQRVLERLVPVEREVSQADGSWYLARLLPYRTIDDRIAGVVLSFVNVTERKQAEEVRLWLSALVTSSSDAIISFSLDRTILSWNGGAEATFGYPAEEAIGQSLGILSVDGDAESDEIMTRLASPESVHNFEAIRRRKDGTRIPVSLTVSPIRDEHGSVMAGTATARDITASRKVEAALRESREQLRLVIENAGEFAIFSTDLERRITTWNTGAQQLLGYAENEVLSREADLIFTEEDRAAGAPEREAQIARTEGRAADDRYHQRKDGSRFWASGAMMSMRDAKGEAVGFVKVLRDQTQVKKAQEAAEQNKAELVQALGDNQSAREALESADAAKDRFLAVLSHELRNPLASIASAARLLDASHADADRSRAAEVVKRQSASMGTLLDDLLDISRLRLGRLALQLAPVDIASVIDSAIEATRPLVQARQHGLLLELPSHALKVHGDALRLTQVLINLIGNAAKYTAPGGHIVVSAQVEQDRVVVAVADDGMGIEPDRIEEMFGMFTQAESTSGRSGGGLGIGLALSRSIVQMHGGEIGGRSEGLGKGSRFRFSLPLGRAAGRREAAANADAAPPDAELPNDATVLVADDNADAGWALSKLLQMSGFEVLVARSGREALELALRHRPQVALLDIGMPDLDGHEVARRIRAADGSRMVLIAATGWGQDSDVRASLEAGFDAHLTKPVDFQALSALVAQQRARRHGGKEK